MSHYAFQQAQPVDRSLGWLNVPICHLPKRNVRQIIDHNIQHTYFNSTRNKNWLSMYHSILKPRQMLSMRVSYESMLERNWAILNTWRRWWSSILSSCDWRTNTRMFTWWHPTKLKVWSHHVHWMLNC